MANLFRYGCISTGLGYSIKTKRSLFDMNGSNSVLFCFPEPTVQTEYLHLILITVQECYLILFTLQSLFSLPKTTDYVNLLEKLKSVLFALLSQIGTINVCYVSYRIKNLLHVSAMSCSTSLQAD